MWDVPLVSRKCLANSSQKSLDSGFRHRPWLPGGAAALGGRAQTVGGSLPQLCWPRLRVRPAQHIPSAWEQESFPTGKSRIWGRVHGGPQQPSARPFMMLVACPSVRTAGHGRALGQKPGPGLTYGVWPRQWDEVHEKQLHHHRITRCIYKSHTSHLRTSNQMEV